MQHTADEKISLSAVADGLTDNLPALAFLVVAAVGIAGLSALALSDWWSGFWQNFSTEVFGALFQFVIFGIILAVRDKARDVQLQRDIAEETRQQIRAFLDEQQTLLAEQERRQLINQLSSRVPGNAAEAVRLLHHHDATHPDEAWFSVEAVVEAIERGGDLSQARLKGIRMPNANLMRAKLSGSDLSEADLEGVVMAWAQLDDAYLAGANLRGADLKWGSLVKAQLREADLTEAVLSGSDLTQASFDKSDLSRALLFDVNLDGTVIFNSTLRGARQLTVDQLRQAADLAGTTLPDGTTLPKRDSSIEWYDSRQPWRIAFEAWISEVKTAGGFIVPGP